MWHVVQRAQLPEGARGSLLPAGWRLSWRCPLVPSGGGLNPLSASCGTNGFFPMEGVHLDPASSGSPRLLDAGHPAFPNNCCKQLASIPPLHHVPQEPDDSLVCEAVLTLALEEGRAHSGGDPPGIQSHTVCLSVF